MAPERGHSWESDNEVTCPNKEIAKQSAQENKNSGPMSSGYLTHAQRCHSPDHTMLWIHTPLIPVLSWRELASHVGGPKGKGVPGRRQEAQDPGC